MRLCPAGLGTCISNAVESSRAPAWPADEVIDGFAAPLRPSRALPFCVATSGPQRLWKLSDLPLRE